MIRTNVTGLFLAAVFVLQGAVQAGAEPAESNEQVLYPRQLDATGYDPAYILKDDRLTPEEQAALADAPPGSVVSYDPVTDELTIIEYDKTDALPGELPPYNPEEETRPEIAPAWAGNPSQITIVNTWPYNCIAQLAIRYENGYSGEGTGIIVGPGLILTAGHVLKDEDGGWATSVSITPGGSFSKYPTYVSTANGSTYAVSKDWTNNLNGNHDWGYIKINGDLGTGYFVSGVVTTGSTYRAVRITEEIEKIVRDNR